MRALLPASVRAYMCSQQNGFNMTQDPKETPDGAAPDKDLSPAARRALKEAAARREKSDEAAGAKELGGPKGAEPTRYGDWERGGRAVDF